MDKAVGVNSTKDILNELPNYYLRIYISLEQLGLTADATIADVWNAMPSDGTHCMSIIPIADFNDLTQFPVSQYAWLEICRWDIARGEVKLLCKLQNQADYRMFLRNSDNEPDGTWWKYDLTQV